MTIHVIPHTKNYQAGFKLLSMGAIIPAKINGSIIKALYSEDGLITFDAGVSFGEAVKLTGKDAKPALLVKDGETSYVGKGVDVHLYTDIELDAKAPAKKKKKKAE